MGPDSWTRPATAGRASRDRGHAGRMPGRRRPRDVHLVRRPGPPRAAGSESSRRRRRDDGAHRRAGRRRRWARGCSSSFPSSPTSTGSWSTSTGWPVGAASGACRAPGTSWRPTGGIRAGPSASSLRPDGSTPMAAGCTPRSHPDRSTSRSASTSRRRSWPSGRGTSSSSRPRTRNAGLSGRRRLAGRRPGPTGTGSATASPSFRSAGWTRSN